MSFTHVVEAIQTYLLESDPPIPLARGAILVGWEFLAQNDAPPRIVIDPDGGEVRAKGPSPTSQTLNGSAVYGTGTLIPPLYTDAELILVHCWGQDFDAAIGLRDSFVRGLELFAPGCYWPKPWKWNKRASYVTKGRELIQPVEIRVPITAVPYVAAPSDVRAVGSSELEFMGGSGSGGCATT